MVKGFAKYSMRNFAKKLDKFRSKRVGTVKIRLLVIEGVPYDLLEFKLAEVKVIGIRPMAPVLNTGPLEGI